jgi:hypothetical protein
MPAKTAPPQAFKFLSQPLIGAVEASATSGQRKVSTVAYSGGVITGGFWGRVVFDLSTTSAPEKMPFLVNHDRAQIAGQVDSTDIADNILVSGTVYGSQASGAQVLSLADEGFAWQMSVHIEPEIIYEIPEGMTSPVNGFAVDGPCYVFKDCKLIEVSFTPTGADPDTSAEFFTKGVAAGRTFEVKPLQEVPTEPTKEFSMNEQEIAALKAENAKLLADKATADNAAAQASAELLKFKREARAVEVKHLFTKLGKAFTEDAAKPFLDMSQEQFAAVASTFDALKPAAPQAPAFDVAKLFSSDLPTPGKPADEAPSGMMKFAKSRAERMGSAKAGASNI